MARLKMEGVGTKKGYRIASESLEQPQMTVIWEPGSSGPQLKDVNSGTTSVSSGIA